jgi:hypothetical protein
MPPLRLESLELLEDPRTLARLIDPFATTQEIESRVRIDREPLSTPGFSGSTHERLVVTLGAARGAFVLKRTDLDLTWVAQRTADREGREALLLMDAELAGVWQTFACPYRAFATAPGRLALLMDDLTDRLFPDRREALGEAEEAALIDALASLHARFWDHAALDRPWLAHPTQFATLIGPEAFEEEADRGNPSPVFQRAHHGWRIAFERLPPAVAATLREPRRFAAACESLPRTLVHGDVKVANFARLPDGRVAAFDWQLVGAAPAAIDMGWYLAVNASRLARSRAEWLARYRECLERHRGGAIGDAEWKHQCTVALWGGASMLLWSKALALEGGEAARLEEWAWWCDQLLAHPLP